MSARAIFLIGIRIGSCTSVSRRFHDNFPEMKMALRLFVRVSLFFWQKALLFFSFRLQYLLVRHPLLAILFLIVLFFGVAMSGFSLFHLYLVLTNQTTNEFYKRCYGKSQTNTSRQSRIMRSQTEKTTVKTSKRRTLNNKNIPSKTLTNNTIIEEKSRSPQTNTPYYKGIWRNITEVMRGWLEEK